MDGRVHGGFSLLPRSSRSPRPCDTPATKGSGPPRKDDARWRRRAEAGAHDERAAEDRLALRHSAIDRPLSSPSSGAKQKSNAVVYFLELSKWIGGARCQQRVCRRCAGSAGAARSQQALAHSLGRSLLAAGSLFPPYYFSFCGRTAPSEMPPDQAHARYYRAQHELPHPSLRPLVPKRACNVDHEAVLHITLEHALQRLVHRLDRDHLDVRSDVVLAAELQHVGSFLNAADD